MTTTSGRCSSAMATAAATVPASPTTSKSASRSNARRRPWRMSSWSSTSSTVVGTHHLFLAVGNRSGCRTVAEPDLDERAASLAVGDVEGRAQALGPLAHDFDAEAVCPARAESAPVVLDAEQGVRWLHHEGDPEVVRRGVPSGVGDGL